MKSTLYLILFALLFPLTVQGLDLTAKEEQFIKNSPKIKIALMPDFSPFSFIKEDKVIGFENDLLKIISKKTGLKFEKQFGIWNKNLTAFKEKKVDMIASISYKKEREPFTKYTTPYYNIPIMIFVRDDFGKYVGLESLKGKKVGILKDVFYTKDLKEHTNIEPIIYETYEDLTEALVFGKIDALVQNLPNINYLIKKNLYTNLVLADELQLPGIKKEDLRFGVNPEKPLLHSIVQKALDDIKEDEWLVITDEWLSVKFIYDEFNLEETEPRVSLSVKEKEYLENNTIKIGMVNDYYPFSYKENDEIHGFSYEYFSLVASKVGLKFEIEIDNWSPTLSKFKNKEIDIIDAISYTKAREEFTNYSDPYFEIPNVIFARTDSIKDYSGLESLKGKRVGITKGIYYFDVIEDLELFELVVFQSSREKMKSLALGKIDAAFNNLTSGQKYILQGGYANIKALEMIDEDIVKKEDLRFGVLKEKKLLYSIIQKAMDAVTTNEKVKLTNKYFGLGYQEKYDTQLMPVKKIPLTQEEKAWISSSSPIRVHNESDWPPYNFNEGGKPLGYSIDTMNLIAKKTGLKIEYVTGPSWNEFLGMMKDGSLDVMLNIVKTPDRLTYLQFTQPYANNPNIIISKKVTLYKDIDSLFGKTVAIPKGFFTDEILRKDYPQIKLLPVKNMLEAMKAISFGKADAAIGELAVVNSLVNEHMMTDLVISGEAILGDSEFSLLHVATRKDLPILASILSKGVESITHEEKRELQKKWLGESKEDRIKLTPQESKYLASKEKITMCAIPEHLPFEQITKDGKHRGISADVINIVAEKIKKPIELLPTKSWVQSLEKLKESKCDILPIAIDTPERHLSMNLTNPYIIESMVVATRQDEFFIQESSELRDRKIALLHGSALIELLKEKYPSIKIVTVRTVHDGLKRVQEEDVFGYVDVLPSIAYTMQTEGIVDLKIAGQLEYELKMSMGSRKDEPLLNSILQKALNEIGEEEIRTIIGKWVSIKVEQSFDYRKLLYVSLFFLAILLVILHKNRSINLLNKDIEKKNGLLEKLSVTDSLTTLYNRRKLDELLEYEINKCKRYRHSLGVCMLDIDYFKTVNDKYGHQVGDDVLISFSKILKYYIRETDTVGRWGGEEFVIICPDTERDRMLALMENIRKEIEEKKFQVIGKKTASFGIAMFTRSDDKHSLIARADEALYEAKAKGRNQVIMN